MTAAYSGTWSSNALGPNNEINGLTLAGVGAGTTIDHVTVRDTADDCFEFFGGTVTATHLFCDRSGDDGIDWDYGYRGSLEHVWVRTPSEHGIEGDNDPNGSTNAPISAPTLRDVVLCGGEVDADRERYGMLFRHATLATVSAATVAGFSAAVDVRDEGTHAVLSDVTFGPGRAHAVAYPETSAAVTGPTADDDAGFNEVDTYADRNGNRVVPSVRACATKPAWSP